MDLSIPDEASTENPLACILIIHGGGWHTGDKTGLRWTQMADLFSSHGYICANINYSLAPSKDKQLAYTAPAFRECRHALYWLHEHAAEFHIDNKRIGVIGSSAGANMALMLGTKPHESGYEIHDIPYTPVQAIINCYGPITRPKDLRVSDYLHADFPPTLSIHGTADQLVEIDQVHILDKLLKELGVNHRVIEVENAPHSILLKSEWGDYSNDALDFFNSHLS